MNDARKLRVLISGASGVTSRAVARSLKLSEKFKDATLLGTDVLYNLYGVYEGLYEKLYRTPYADESNYREVIERIIQKEKIDAAIVIPELEAVYWAEHPFEVAYLGTPPTFSKTVLSKKRVYDLLAGTDLVPPHQILSRGEILSNEKSVKLQYPFWVRDFAEGTTSGAGSYRPGDYSQLKAWLQIKTSIEDFMLSGYLPGRNYGVFLLYQEGKLLKACAAERLIYFMSRISVSGITGNASKGKLVNEPNVVRRADAAVQKICESVGETMNGLVVVDMREDEERVARVTEINIKHAAITSCLALGNFNISEYQLLCALGRSNELSPEVELKFPPNNLFLRDIDGLPVYIEDYKELKIGESR